jgi:hypothetical protein
VADLDGGGPDVVLRVRWWTNLTSGVTGVSAVLTNRAGFKALVVPRDESGAEGTVDGAPAWFPWPVPEEMLIPAHPPPPASWQGSPAAVVLFQETRDAQGQLLSSVGPLARQDAVQIAVRAAGSAGGRKGWVRFSRDFQLVGQDFSESPGGEPPPQPHESSRVHWDLNGDGWLDFVWVFCAHGSYDPLMGRFIGRSWTSLYPLRHSRILSRGLPVNAPISLTPAAPDEWQTGGVTLRYEAYFPMTEFESSEFPGLVGLRFEGDDGTHLAWLRPGDDKFAFEPRPGVPLPAGAVPRTLAAAKSDDELVLSWNRSLSGLVLESASKLEPAAWQPVPVETAGRRRCPSPTRRGFSGWLGPASSRVRSGCFRDCRVRFRPSRSGAARITWLWWMPAGPGCGGPTAAWIARATCCPRVSRWKPPQCRRTSSMRCAPELSVPGSACRTPWTKPLPFGSASRTCSWMRCPANRFWLRRAHWPTAGRLCRRVGLKSS